uniref:Neuferricin n=1 Tax=Apteryx owenii TaxID=8824 RepID=A0A8B9QHZ4_APTOW
MLAVQSWLSFYSSNYVFVGKLVGRFYDENGAPTEALRQAEAAIEEGLKFKAESDQRKQQFPPCNSEWSSAGGSRFWCSKQRRAQVGAKALRAGVAEIRQARSLLLSEILRLCFQTEAEPNCKEQRSCFRLWQWRRKQRLDWSPPETVCTWFEGEPLRVCENYWSPIWTAGLT